MRLFTVKRNTCFGKLLPVHVLGVKKKTGVTRVLIIFQGKPMFSHYYKRFRCHPRDTATCDIRCTNSLDILLKPLWNLWYPAVGFGQKMAVSRDFSGHLSFCPLISDFHSRISRRYFFEILLKYVRYYIEI